MGLSVHITPTTSDAVRLTELAAMTASGEIRPVTERAYPLADTAAAMRHVEVEHTGGKVHKQV